MARIAGILERRWLIAWRWRRVATISESTRDDLSALGVQDVSIVPVGLDWVPPADPPFKPEPPTCVYLGRLRATKNPADALRAFGEIRRNIPGARMIVAGTGPEEAELRRRYAAEDVEFQGRISESAKIELLRRAHLALVPSLREGWNLVVTEAASMGTPSVGYDVRGVRESVRDGKTGVLVPAGDWRALGAAASRLLADRDRRARVQSHAMRIGSAGERELVYCLNVHPGETWAQNLQAIETEAVAVKAVVAPDRPFGLGLRLSARA